MKYLLLIFMVLIGSNVFSQSDLEKVKELTLQDRFLLMKTSSQTFQDYKVIKELVLDGVWKISQDSLSRLKLSVTKGNQAIAQLESVLLKERDQFAKAQAAVQTVEFDSRHISFFGFTFGKTLFVSMVLLLTVGLLVVIVMLAGKLKMQYDEAKETKDLLNFSTQEFEDYKRKALEKQAKLSRELQTERNKMSVEKSNGFMLKSADSSQINL